MTELRDDRADEVLRHARAHMDPTVFDRARVARKLAETRLSWDGHSGVGGTPLPELSASGGGQVVLGAVKAAKLAVLKGPALALAGALIVGGATMGLRAVSSSPSRTAPQVTTAQAAPSLRQSATATALSATPGSDPAPTQVAGQETPRVSVNAAASMERQRETPRRRRSAARDAATTASKVPPPAEATPPVARSSFAQQAVQDPLMQDIELLRHAARALHAGEPRRAQALLEEHARRFTYSETRHERHALAFHVACLLGEGEIAAQHRSALLHEVPQSPLAARVRDGCVDGRH